jgi:hypothetical protein
VEASGSYSWLVDEMESSGHCPKLCNPFEAKRRMALTKKTEYQRLALKQVVQDPFNVIEHMVFGDTQA